MLDAELLKLESISVEGTDTEDLFEDKPQVRLPEALLYEQPLIVNCFDDSFPELEEDKLKWIRENTTMVNSSKSQHPG